MNSYPRRSPPRAPLASRAKKPLTTAPQIAYTVRGLVHYYPEMLQASKKGGGPVFALVFFDQYDSLTNTRQKMPAVVHAGARLRP